MRKQSFSLQRPSLSYKPPDASGYGDIVYLKQLMTMKMHATGLTPRPKSAFISRASKTKPEALPHVHMRRNAATERLVQKILWQKRRELLVKGQNRNRINAAFRQRKNALLACRELNKTIGCKSSSGSTENVSAMLRPPLQFALFRA